MAILCISRQFGAGGATVVERVAKRLNYDYVEDELFSRIAEVAKIDLDQLKDAGKKNVGALNGFWSSLISTSYLGRAAQGIDEKQIIYLLESIIPEIASRGNVVFLGRGSQFILPDDYSTIKILLVAKKDTRIQFMMDHHKMGRNSAEKAVIEWEKSRADFLRNFTSGDPNDLSLYDMIINTDDVKLEWVEDLICELAVYRDKRTD